MKNKYTKLERGLILLGILFLAFLVCPPIRHSVLGFLDGWEGLPPRFIQ